jgi:hypothetical protein
MSSENSVYSPFELALVELAQTPNLTLAQRKSLLTLDFKTSGQSDELALAGAKHYVKTCLEGNAAHVARQAVAIASAPPQKAVPVPKARAAAPVAPPKPAPTLAEVSAKLARLEAEYASSANAKARAAEAEAQAAEARARAAQLATIQARMQTGPWAPNAHLSTDYDPKTGIQRLGVAEGQR